MGGKNHIIRRNLIMDTVTAGAGINISSNFDPVPFSGDILIEENIMIRTGSLGEGARRPRGSIWIWGAEQDINARLLILGNQIYDSSYSGISLEGTKSLLQDLIIDDLLFGRC